MGSSRCRLTHPCGKIVGPLRSARVTRLLRYYGSIRPCAPHRYASPSWVRHSESSLRIGATGSHVPHKSLSRARAAFMPVTARAVSRYPPSFIPGQQLEPGFDDVHMLSTRRQRFTHVRLPGSHLTGWSRLFRERSPPEPLGPSSFRWFGTRPCSPIPGGRPPSLVPQGCFSRPCWPPLRAVVAHSHRAYRGVVRSSRRSLREHSGQPRNRIHSTRRPWCRTRFSRDVRTTRG